MEGEVLEAQLLGQKWGLRLSVKAKQTTVRQNGAGSEDDTGGLPSLDSLSLEDDSVYTLKEGAHLTVLLPRQKKSNKERGLAHAEGGSGSSGGALLSPPSSPATTAPPTGPTGGLTSMVGGLEAAVSSIREVVRASLFHPESFTRFGLEPPKGILLHGPPGTGKTLVARSIAVECGVELFVINGPEIMTKFYGESEAKVSE